MDKITDNINSQLLAYTGKILFSPQIIFCLNISEQTLTALQKRFANATVKQGDLAELKDLRNGSIDLLLANVVETSLDRKIIFAEAARILNKNGLFIFATKDHDTIIHLLDDI